MRVNTESFIRLLQNTTLFTAPKTNVGQVVGLHFFTDSVVGFASDDNVIIEDRVEWEDGNPGPENFYQWYITTKDAKALLKEIQDTGDILPDSETDLMALDIEFADCPNPDIWEAIPKITSQTDLRVTQATIDIRPERLAKFSRLKADDDYPLSTLVAHEPTLNKVVMAFRYGPSVRGVMSPIMSTVIQKELGDLYERVTFHGAR